jgi:hypothetical protein
MAPALPAERAALALFVLRRWPAMDTLATAAQKHHMDVNSSVLIHIRKATATTLASPKGDNGPATGDQERAAARHHVDGGKLSPGGDSGVVVQAVALYGHADGTPHHGEQVGGGHRPAGRGERPQPPAPRCVRLDGQDSGGDEHGQDHVGEEHVQPQRHPSARRRHPIGQVQPHQRLNELMTGEQHR